MTAVRIEKDLLGEAAVPADALYGIHTVRALANFPLAGRPVRPELVHAYGAVKLACARANHELDPWPEPTASALFRACEEMMRGELDAHVVVDALQGGAGTSTNMNVNEVLANRALALLGRPPGETATVSPLADLNRHQSTNDTYPTALRVAALGLLQDLEPPLIALVAAFQLKEKEFAGVVKLGRTEMQDAVLTTLGREMSAYAEAFSRDRWRLYKCQERLRVVNLGGTAIGTALGAPRPYVFRATEHLRALTGFGLARAEDLVEATQNWDAIVEVSGILKALAANLLKVAGDLRLLSSGPHGGLGELRLPPRQAGSSLMPGKINPVIPEAVSQAALAVFANDQAITTACALGSLELNPFAPLIADALLGSLALLTRACDVFQRLCVAGLEADAARCRAQVENSTAVATALVETLGYEGVQALARDAASAGRTVRELVVERGLMTAEAFDAATSPERVTRLGHPVRKATP
jgi:aspartate ammonia-lyase